MYNHPNKYCVKLALNSYIYVFIDKNRIQSFALNQLFEVKSKLLNDNLKI